MAHILVDFTDDGQAVFDVHTTEDSQILTGMLGLEGYLASKTGLDTNDIREIMDEMKDGVEVKPTRIEEDVEDAEVE